MHSVYARIKKMNLKEEIKIKIRLHVDEEQKTFYIGIRYLKATENSKTYKTLNALFKVGLVDLFIFYEEMLH